MQYLTQYDRRMVVKVPLKGVNSKLTESSYWALETRNYCSTSSSQATSKSYLTRTVKPGVQEFRPPHQTLEGHFSQQISNIYIDKALIQEHNITSTSKCMIQKEDTRKKVSKRCVCLCNAQEDQSSN